MSGLIANNKLKFFVPISQQQLIQILIIFFPLFRCVHISLSFIAAQSPFFLQLIIVLKDPQKEAFKSLLNIKVVQRCPAYDLYHVLIWELDCLLPVVWSLIEKVKETLFLTLLVTAKTLFIYLFIYLFGARKADRFTDVRKNAG